MEGTRYGGRSKWSFLSRRREDPNLRHAGGDDAARRLSANRDKMCGDRARRSATVDDSNLPPTRTSHEQKRARIPTVETCSSPADAIRKQPHAGEGNLFAAEEHSRWSTRSDAVGPRAGCVSAWRNYPSRTPRDGGDKILSSKTRRDGKADTSSRSSTTELTDGFQFTRTACSSAGPRRVVRPRHRGTEKAMTERA